MKISNVFESPHSAISKSYSTRSPLKLRCFFSFETKSEVLSRHMVRLSIGTHRRIVALRADAGWSFAQHFNFSLGRVRCRIGKVRSTVNLRTEDIGAGPEYELRAHVQAFRISIQSNTRGISQKSSVCQASSPKS